MVKQSAHAIDYRVTASYYKVREFRGESALAGNI